MNPSQRDLTALIIGSGFAGQGHAAALRACGIHVIAMASRTQEVVERVSRELGIPHASTDWRACLREMAPDIVAIGTPGGVHEEMAGAAMEAGCHVLCDKPLATSADAALRMYNQARAAGVQTAYAASYRYQPQALFAHEWVQAGNLGEVYEVECVSHYNWPKLTSFGWPHRLETGGGRLNNNFTHKLAIVLKILGGEVLAVTGETRNDLKQAPVGPRMHDFREFTRSALTAEQARALEFRDVDSDWAYTVLARIGGPGTPIEQAASATFRHSALWAGRNGDYIALYGEHGTLHIDGAYAQGAVWWKPADGEWIELAIPVEIRDALPEIDDDTQRNWNVLAREFVRAIRGESADLLTFREGWLFQEVIDAVRSGGGWTRLKSE